MDEVPRLQLPLLAFDDQRARAREDDEVLLRRFTVVRRGGVAPAEDADVDADLVEAVLAILEGRARAEPFARDPARIAHVDDERLGHSADDNVQVVSSVAVLGLGAMGSRIARRLLDAGHDVIVWNRTPAK